MNYLVYVCTLHIEKVYKNKKSNVNLICGSVKLKSKPKKKKVACEEEIQRKRKVTLLFFFNQIKILSTLKL